ncbi:class I SAM-dependent methyltransferase [Candidatus Woesearchaeota archaeon]|nr:class I SAM-dependent methyltransferase [Candidatus Woesearchaeota archaeon]
MDVWQDVYRTIVKGEPSERQLQLTSTISSYLVRKAIGDDPRLAQEAEILDRFLAPLFENDEIRATFEGFHIFSPHAAGELLNRYKSIKQELDDIKPDILVVGACGLSPLGLVYAQENPDKHVIETDLFEVESARQKADVKRPTNYQLMKLDLLDIDNIKDFSHRIKGAATVTGLESIAFVTEGLTFYFDDRERSILNRNLQVLSKIIRPDKHASFIFDYFVWPVPSRERDFKKDEGHPIWESFQRLVSNITVGQKCFMKTIEEVKRYLAQQNFINVRHSRYSRNGNAHNIFICDYRDNKMIDAFGNKRYSPADVFLDQKLLSTINILLFKWLRHLEVDESEVTPLVAATMDSCSRSTQESDNLEEDLIAEYDRLNVVQTMMGPKMVGRARDLFNYVAPYLPTGEARANFRVLDIGTGPGRVGKKYYDEGFDVTLQDVAGDGREKRSPDVIALADAERPLKYDLHGNDEPLKYEDNIFDLTLLKVVLHHCDDPLKVLREAARVTRIKGKIAILESMYDIKRENLPEESYQEHPDLYDAYFSLDRGQQKKYGTFLDWFLNKLSFRNNANVPCNFNSPPEWEKIFNTNGLKVIEKKVVGIDQMVTPEFHVLYILEKT